MPGIPAGDLTGPDWSEGKTVSKVAAEQPLSPEPEAAREELGPAPGGDPAVPAPRVDPFETVAQAPATSPAAPGEIGSAGGASDSTGGECKGDVLDVDLVGDEERKDWHRERLLEAFADAGIDFAVIEGLVARVDALEKKLKHHGILGSAE